MYMNEKDDWAAQVQPDALRPRQSAPQERAGLQVQHLLPGPHRQDQGARYRYRYSIV